MEKCWDGRIGTYRNRHQPSFNCSRPKPRGPASSPPKSRPGPCGRRPNTENCIFSGQPIRYQSIHRGQLPAPAQSSLQAYQALQQKTTTPRMPYASLRLSLLFAASAVHHGAWEMAGHKLNPPPEAAGHDPEASASHCVMHGAGAERERGGNAVKPERWAEQRGRLQQRGWCFPAGNGAPRGLEVQRPRRATGSPPSACVRRES